MIKYSKEYFEGISTKEQFISFLNNLSADFTNNHSEWENVSINDYLSSIAAWCYDCDFECHTKNEDNVNFGLVSLLFYMGKFYE